MVLALLGVGGMFVIPSPRLSRASVRHDLMTMYV